ncbi:uncharacterized protein LOC131604275 [Vicia villosa]|uniref:uncharacterized protein LOC131604275 n=1 Tax=Vicia villosa TaxID=3911 RepID=UPI00273B29E5|nr:uncharacterized protein LOC131604275 [Vicia villosa]
MNRALLLKWKWRILMERQAIWSKFLEFRYRKPRLIVQATKDVTSNFEDAIWWRDVISNDLILDRFEEGFPGCVKSIIRNGKNILFWHSVWLGDHALHVKFPELYDISTRKLCSVSEVRQVVDGSVFWDLDFLFAADSNVIAAPSASDLHSGDGLVSVLLQLHAVNLQHLRDCLIQSNHGQTEEEDQHIRNLNSSGLYSVSSITSLVGNSKDRAWNNNLIKQLEVIWNTNLPIRIKLFAWRVLTDKLPVKEILIQRGVSNFPSVGCVFCSNHQENSNHLFFDCYISKEIWDKVLAWLGIESNLSFLDLLSFDAIQLKVKKVKVKDRINVIWVATLWSLWTMRNAVIFQDKLFSFDEVFYNILFLSWRWLSLSHSLVVANFYKWFKNPLNCI